MNITHSTYLLVNTGSLLVPLLSSFHPRLQFQRQWPALLPALLVAGLLLIAWDIIFTQLGVWGFNPGYVLGLYIAGLPLEEILFFFCIPYACLFSYHSLQVLWPRFGYGLRTSKIISLLVCLAGAAGVIAFPGKYYTDITLLLLLAFTAWAGLVKPQPWMGRFLASYTLMLLPFLLVNGILTGSWIAAPVVWYNPLHIAGPRIGTIPVEDVAFGMLMIGMQTALYEYFRKRKTVAATPRPTRPVLHHH